MKAICLVKNGKANQAFEIREQEIPKPGPAEVLIKVQGFGLNFADVMARLGMYKDCPPLPAVLGYEVVGHVSAIGNEVKDVSLGQRVTALTRFGGYAEYAIGDPRAMAVIDEDLGIGEATALATQYCTAYYCADEMVRLHTGDKVLIHAAAGGVGIALIQLAKNKGCEIFGTASTHKLDFLRSIGVDHPIDYRNVEFHTAVKKIAGEKSLDVIFDPIGGKNFKDGFNLLASGGRIITFGASEMTNANNAFKKIKFALQFGIFHPVQFVMNSKSILGVNMLRIADDRPNTFKRVIDKVIEMQKEGILKPVVAKVYNFDEIAEAHEFLASRQSIGKVAVKV